MGKSTPETFCNSVNIIARKRYHERKEAGVCVRCGTRPPRKGHATCTRCNNLTKRCREKQIIKQIEEGKRESRIIVLSRRGKLKLNMAKAIFEVIKFLEKRSRNLLESIRKEK